MKEIVDIEDSGQGGTDNKEKKRITTLIPLPNYDYGRKFSFPSFEVSQPDPSNPMVPKCRYEFQTELEARAFIEWNRAMGFMGSAVIKQWNKPEPMIPSGKVLEVIEIK